MILGHRGMVGSALRRMIPDATTFQTLGTDLRNPDAARVAVNTARPDVLYLCAARVGGIGRNIAEPGRMIYDNLMIQTNVIEAARIAGVKLVVFLGSSCIYPRVQQFDGGISEDCLMGGRLEETNEPYAVAKIAGIKMLEAYRREYGMEYLAVMPCNLYGPGDNFDPHSGHFLPAMIRKMHDARHNDVVLWGTGTPRRELMHVDDCARIITELVAKEARGLINVGWGEDATIAAWAALVSRATGRGDLGVSWDTSKPDGVARKLLDVSKMRSFGCSPRIDAPDGIKSNYAWFLENVAK